MARCMTHGGYTFGEIVDFSHFIESRFDVAVLPPSTGTFTGDFKLYKKTYPTSYEVWWRGVIGKRVRERICPVNHNT